MVRGAVRVALGPDPKEKVARLHLDRLEARDGFLRETIMRHRMRVFALGAWLSVHFSADEMVDYYAEYVSVGGDRFGLTSGARTLFRKPLHQLAPDEAALLMAFAWSPETLDPACHPERAREARDSFLTHMAAARLVSADALPALQATPVQVMEKCLVAALAIDHPAGPRALEVSVPGPAGTLAGTLTLPASGRPPFPAVVTVTGSGAHHRDGNRTPEHPYRPFHDIADTLAGCGIATLRLDDRGVGGSSGDANSATAEDTAADTHAGLRFLRARADVDPRRTGLIGHSYGGVIAPMVAAEDPTLAALVLLAGPARTFRETMRYQHRFRIWNDPAIAPIDRDAALVEAMRQQGANVSASSEAWRGSIQDRDPLPTARRLRLPVLILQGLTDSAVEPEDARLLEQAIREGGNHRVERRLFPGVNHHFQRDPVGAREGYDRLPTQRLAPEALSALCSWLAASLKK